MTLGCPKEHLNILNIGAMRPHRDKTSQRLQIGPSEKTPSCAVKAPFAGTRIRREAIEKGEEKVGMVHECAPVFLLYTGLQMLLKISQKSSGNPMSTDHLSTQQ